MSEQKELRNIVSINQESYLCSLVKDATSIGLLGFLCWFNHNFIGGSYFVNFLILCMILLYIAEIAESGAENRSFYYGVSKEKIKQIKQILKEQENVN